MTQQRKRIFLLGATGTIGRAAVQALLDRGHAVVCFLREGSRRSPAEARRLLPGAELRFGEVTDPQSLEEDGFCGERFDALVSCMTSRSGAPKDAWAIDYAAHVNALAAAKAAGVSQMVLLSAICVQKPRLEFQKAKLAFEQELIDSGLTYSIVRPTAFFKSLSGQIERIKEGKPYLLVGNGRVTACKPISDGDLAAYLADCLEDESLQNQILPIGGPGPAVTPKEQAEKLFALLGLEPRYKRVPVTLFWLIIGALSLAGRVSSKAAEKAEFARIGRYYATESMLVWNEEAGHYDVEATPSTGSETLFGFYEKLVRGEVKLDRGDHAVF
ncbi:MAG: NAD(P)H-binding protein [Pseudomonadota bacterium]